MTNVPDKFAEIERLSDEERAEVYSGSMPQPGRTEKEQRLLAALKALSDDDFIQLKAWTLFGRDYSPNDGEPGIVLGDYERDALMEPREIEESMLEDKPIGEYLRAAVDHLQNTIPDEEQRALWERQAEERALRDSWAEDF